MEIFIGVFIVVALIGALFTSSGKERERKKRIYAK